MDKNVLHSKKIETGQILPIVALGILVIIALAALILDGGVLMANRRAAQAAADAGALAGARLSCLEKTKDEIEAEALYYAIDLNKADPSTTAVYDPDTGLVKVVAKLEQESWFARIFGQEDLATGASASAGCYYPSIADRMMPIAFYYEKPPVDAGDADCKADGSCALVNWDFKVLMDTLIATSTTSLPLDNIYVVANTTKVCEKPVTGDIVCSEMAGNEGGNRTFIEFPQGFAETGATQKIIEDGLLKPIFTPAWISGNPDKVTVVYDDYYTPLEKIVGYEGYLARLITIPLFDKVCSDKATCPPYPDPKYGYDINYYTSPGVQNLEYRLVGFAPFVLTCVTKDDKCKFGNCIPAKTYPNTTKKAICPGYLASASTDKSAIEGYFVKGLPAGMFEWGTGGVDAGIYIISLSD